MTRLWNPHQEAAPTAEPAHVPWAPPLDPVPEVVDLDDEPVGHYPARPVRPAAQLAARVALWSAVAFGCLGGIAGLVRQPAAPAAPAGVSAPEQRDVPAPVAGVAEIAVEAWLTAGGDDQERLRELFVTGVSLADRGADPIPVEGVTTVAGRPIDDGYWAVTVAAAVIEPVPPGEVGAEDGPSPTTWYVEVGVVGTPEEGLAALTTPSVLAGPPHIADGWRLDHRGARTPDDDDPVLVTVQGFLRALLAGEGDPAPYLAPGASVATGGRPPFTALVVLEMAVTGEPDGDEALAWTQVEVTTPGGARRVVAYEVALARRADRWEVVALSGVPSDVRAPDGAGTVGDDGDGAEDGGATDDDPAPTGTGEGPVTSDRDAAPDPAAGAGDPGSASAGGDGGAGDVLAGEGPPVTGP